MNQEIIIGHWEAVVLEPVRHIIIIPEGTRKAEPMKIVTAMICYPGEEAGFEERLTRARLIAAAPEMLAALELLDMDWLPEDVADIVSATIAKATKSEAGS